MNSIIKSSNTVDNPPDGEGLADIDDDIETDADGELDAEGLRDGEFDIPVDADGEKDTEADGLP